MVLKAFNQKDSRICMKLYEYIYICVYIYTVYVVLHTRRLTIPNAAVFSFDLSEVVRFPFPLLADGQILKICGLLWVLKKDFESLG